MLRDSHNMANHFPVTSTAEVNSPIRIKSDPNILSTAKGKSQKPQRNRQSINYLSEDTRKFFG